MHCYECSLKDDHREAIGITITVPSDYVLHTAPWSPIQFW